LGIPRGVLNQRLVRVLDVRVLAKVSYSARPPRYDYRLTAKGRDLWPVVTAMRQWGDKYAAPEGAPVRVIHEHCGEISEAHLVCSACGRPFGPLDFKSIPGPGALGWGGAWRLVMPEGATIAGKTGRDLLGRRDEQQAIDRLLERVRSGRGGVLVVRGEAGVGKTSLLEYLEDRAAGCGVVRA